MSVVKELVDLARKEARILKEFATEPRGLFETVDEMIKTARSKSKELRKEKLRIIGL